MSDPLTAHDVESAEARPAFRVVKSLWARVLLRRAVLLSLFGGLLYLNFVYEPELRIANVMETGRDLVRKDPKNPSLTATFYATPRTSIHLHVLGADTVCQFHFHQGNEEVTLIVQGLAHVTTGFGRDGQPAKTDEVYKEGTLVALPRYCGHRWHNVTPGTFNTNLVFSRPKFAFNEFIEETDSRILKAPPPAMVNMHDRLATFVASGKPFEDDPLPALDGTLHALFFRDSYVIHAEGAEPASVTVISGEADLTEPQRAHLVPYDLAMIAHANGARLVASGRPVAALLLYPERQ